MPKKLRPGRRISPEILPKEARVKEKREGPRQKVARVALSTGKLVDINIEPKVTGPMAEIQTPHEFLAHCYATDPDVRKLAGTLASRCLYRSEADQLKEIVNKTGSSPIIIFDALMLARDEVERSARGDQT